MTPTLSQLLSARPKAVEAIRKSYGVQWLRSTVPEHDDAETIRDYCASEQIGSPWLDSIETLLDLIESRCVADAPLSDAEIEGMKWTWYETAVGPIGFVSFHAHDAENAANAMASHNSDIARCHREIKRLRKGAEHAS